MHDAKLKGDVKSAFDFFDKDGSGHIDKEELADLSKKLGYELNEEELRVALKDLDMNEDGVIDLEQFARWYFTGMKPYKGAARTMMKIGKHSMSIFNKLAEDASKLLPSELDFKDNNFSLSLNAPDAPKTTLSATAHVCGARYNEMKSHLNQYEGTFNFKALPASLKEVMRPGDKPMFKVEFYMTAPRNAEAHLDAFKKGIHEFF